MAAIGVPHDDVAATRVVHDEAETGEGVAASSAGDFAGELGQTVTKRESNRSSGTGSPCLTKDSM